MADEYLSDDGDLAAGPVFGNGDAAQGVDLDADLDQQRLDEAAQLAAENAQALEQVPDQVKKYIIRLHQAMSNGNIAETQMLYERNWGQLTAEFYKTEEWPTATVIASLVRSDEVFLTFYRWLYFRHLYSRFATTIDVFDRTESFENFCNLFNYVLNSDGPVPLELPPGMLWDLVDEFLWQFGEFSSWRQRLADKSEEDLQYLAEAPQVWSAYSVLNVLYSLTQKSKIQEQLRASRRGEDMDTVADDFGKRPLYRLLGYFSLTGLLRVHVMLSDYTLALKILDDIDVRTMSSVSTRLHSVHAAHVSAYYHIGAAYLFLRRYGDAIDNLSRGVAHFHKNRRQTPAPEIVGKVVDRILGLAAVAHSLAPAYRLEDWVRNGVTDKYGDAHARLLAVSTVDDAVAAADEILTRCLPKSVSPAPPALPEEPIAAGSSDAEAAAALDPSRHQIELLLSDVRARAGVAETRAYLKLYTTLAIDKLASLKTGNTGATDADVLAELAVAKGAMREVRWRERATAEDSGADGEFGGLLDGAVEIAGDLIFAIDGQIVSVTETKRPRHVTDYFLRRSQKAAEALEAIRSKPLPAPTNRANANGSAGGARPPTTTGSSGAPGPMGERKVGWASSVKAAA